MLPRIVVARLRRRKALRPAALGPVGASAEAGAGAAARIWQRQVVDRAAGDEG